MEPICHLTTEHEQINAIAALKAIIFDTPEANEAKIQLIKEELISGRYKINTHHISEKLLEHALRAQETALV
jgi:anti-sigma28 factor (negative regulator of flagellin synthesis)